VLDWHTHTAPSNHHHTSLFRTTVWMDRSCLDHLAMASYRLWSGLPSSVPSAAAAAAAAGVLRPPTLSNWFTYTRSKGQRWNLIISEHCIARSILSDNSQGHSQGVSSQPGVSLSSPLLPTWSMEPDILSSRMSETRSCSTSFSGMLSLCDMKGMRTRV
jgi:hypothetical protein